MHARPFTGAILVASMLLSSATAAPKITVERDDKAAVLSVHIDGQTVIQYQYGPSWAIPHFWPVRSPSGRNMLEQKAQPPEKFPHHRSLWIADRVQLAGHPVADFYHEWQNVIDAGKPELGHRHFIRHQSFDDVRVADDAVSYQETLRWIVDQATPVLDEHRRVKITALGDGEYLIDLSWRLTASYGDVRFLSDAVHYAWPYVRINRTFNGDHGGTLTGDNGDAGQADTNGRAYDWIDYANTVDGVTEGLAVFVYPDGHKHKWLTRSYGTFGPRRADALSGTHFTLKKGQSLPGRVGILIHRGDAKTGAVTDRYQQYRKMVGSTEPEHRHEPSR